MSEANVSEYTETGLCPKCKDELFRVQTYSNVTITEQFDTESGDWIEVDKDYGEGSDERFECDSCKWDSDQL